MSKLDVDVSDEESTATSVDLGSNGIEVDPSPTYITIETTDGQLEHVKVHVNDEHFGTSAPILNYLAEHGEIVPTKNRGSSKRNAKPQPKHHRPSEAQNPADNYVLDVRPQRNQRSGSVMITPALIKDLKENRARIVSKGGQCNVNLKNVPKKRMQFVRDIFTTAVDMQWRYTLLVFFASFLLSWLFFGVVYFVISTYRTDFEPDHLPSGAGQVNGTWKPCIWAVEDFTSCFLFSLETQHTIGYGSRQITEKCPEAIIVVAVQSVIGVIISCCMAGIVFAKLARPKCRTNTILFSNNAVITKRNGHLYLLFRVGNMRHSHLIETHVGAQLIHQKRTTSEGESISFDMEELKLNSQTYFSKSKFDSTDSGTEDEDEEEEEPTKEGFLLLWPVTVAHRIDKTSPFYEMGPREILTSKFELVVTCEGINETNGNSVQARSSYLPNEILWGHRFNNIVSYTNISRFYQVDFANLNAVKPDETPRMSARDLDLKRLMHQRERYSTLRSKSPKETKVFTITRSSRNNRNIGTTLEKQQQISDIIKSQQISDVIKSQQQEGNRNYIERKIPVFSTGSEPPSPKLNGPSSGLRTLAQSPPSTSIAKMNLSNTVYTLDIEDETSKEPTSSL